MVTKTTWDTVVEGAVEAEVAMDPADVVGAAGVEKVVAEDAVVTHPTITTTTAITTAIIVDRADRRRMMDTGMVVAAVVVRPRSSSNSPKKVAAATPKCLLRLRRHRHVSPINDRLCNHVYGAI